jgi:AcrR family transcriptional regulator
MQSYTEDMSASNGFAEGRGRVRRPSREEVRRRLLDAARHALVQYGYGAASVDTITELAGLSRGALYSNFVDKDDLYLTLLDELEREQVESVAALHQTGVSAADLVARVAGRTVPPGSDPRTQLILQTELWLVGTRNDAVRERLAAIQRRTVDAIASTLHGDHLGLSPQEIGLVVNAIADGLLAQRITDPHAQSDGLLLRALSALATAQRPPTKKA